MTLEQYQETIQHWQDKHTTLKAQAASGVVDYDLMVELGHASSVLSVANDPQRFLMVA